MADYRDLPGFPRRALVKRVRSHLWLYGIRPKGEEWRATWAWASAIARSYHHTHWPLPHEIGAQYVLLLLNRMNERRGLKLPYRASKVMPEEVRVLLPESVLPLLTDGKDE